MELLDTPEDIPFLSHLVQREIICRVLRTPQGARLRTIATTGDLGNRTARAIIWLRDDFTKRLHMEELAGIARMGVSDTSPSVPSINRDEPASIPKTVEVAKG
jgi:AraC-type transcriptional regulator N-terminus